MSILADILQLLVTLVLTLFLLRFWIQWSRVDFYNPVAQLIVRASGPFCRPFRRWLPRHRQYDWASLICVFLTALAGSYAIAAMYPPLPELLQAIRWSLRLIAHTALNLLFWVLLIQALASWFASRGNPALDFMEDLTHPLLRPIRRLIPPAGGIDFSPMVLMLLVYILMRVVSRAF